MENKKFHRKFQRRIENFSCEHCGTVVTGDGYTNHCSQCFYSKHVDIYPGDRLATCLGVMKPIEVLYKKGQWVVVQHCVRCGKVMRNRVHKNDNIDKLIALQKNLITAIIK